MNFSCCASCGLAEMRRGARRDRPRLRLLPLPGHRGRRGGPRPRRCATAPTPTGLRPRTVRRSGGRWLARSPGGAAGAVGRRPRPGRPGRPAGLAQAAAGREPEMPAPPRRAPGSAATVHAPCRSPCRAASRRPSRVVCRPLYRASCGPPHRVACRPAFPGSLRCTSAPSSSARTPPRDSPAGSASELLRAHSTNVANLRAGRWRTLVTSAVFVEEPLPAPYAAALLAALGTAEARWGDARGGAVRRRPSGRQSAGLRGLRRRTREGAPSATTTGASPGVSAAHAAGETGADPPDATARAVDVGASYGFYATVGALAATVPHRGVRVAATAGCWRWAYAPSCAPGGPSPTSDIWRRSCSAWRGRDAALGMRAGTEDRRTGGRARA